MKREKIPTEFIIETLTDGYYWSDFTHQTNIFGIY